MSPSMGKIFVVLEAFGGRGMGRRLELGLKAGKGVVT
jgi:hypothetical protein